ncbi:hypothetical protein [Sphingomonas sp. DT-51]
MLAAKDVSRSSLAPLSMHQSVRESAYQIMGKALFTPEYMRDLDQG